MTYAVQIAAIVRAALKGDTKTVLIYAKWIAAQEEWRGEKLHDADAARRARIIKRSYGELPPGTPVTLDNDRRS